MKRLLLLGKSHVVAPYRAWRKQLHPDLCNLYCDALAIGEKQGGLGSSLLAGSKIITSHPKDLPTFFFSSKSSEDTFNLNEYDAVVFFAGTNPLDPRFWSFNDGVPLLSESVLQAMINGHPRLTICAQLGHLLGNRLLIAFNPLPKVGFPQFKTLIDSPRKQSIIAKNQDKIRMIYGDISGSACKPRFLLPEKELLCRIGIQTLEKYMSDNPEDYQHANNKYGAHVLRSCINELDA